MNNGKRLQRSASALLVAVLAVMAFVRGDLQLWLLIGIFTVWALWMFIPIVLQVKHKHDFLQQKETSKSPVHTDSQTENSSAILLRHVSYRITDHLRSAYPDVTWEWCEKDPLKIITCGGTARIKLFNVADFNYADVVFDNHANISCDMMRLVPLSELESEDSGDESPKNEKPQSPTDPQIWYELQGRKVLENLIADLHSKNHSGLIIKENGDICIRQADAEVACHTIKSFPDRSQWQRLIQVFEKEGIMAAITPAGLALTW